MTVLLPDQEHRSRHKLYKTRSYAKLENDSFMDILRYSHNAVTVTRHFVDPYISSGIFMTEKQMFAGLRMTSDQHSNFDRAGTYWMAILVCTNRTLLDDSNLIPLIPLALCQLKPSVRIHRYLGACALSNRFSYGEGASLS
jgi:hypothetical protein